MNPKDRPDRVEIALDYALSITLFCLFLLPFALMFKSLFLDPPPSNHTQHQPPTEQPSGQYADSLVCPD